MLLATNFGRDWNVSAVLGSTAGSPAPLPSALSLGGVADRSVRGEPTTTLTHESPSGGQGTYPPGWGVNVRGFVRGVVLAGAESDGVCESFKLRETSRRMCGPHVRCLPRRSGLHGDQEPPSRSGRGQVRCRGAPGLRGRPTARDANVQHELRQSFLGQRNRLRCSVVGNDPEGSRLRQRAASSAGSPAPACVDVNSGGAHSGLSSQGAPFVTMRSRHTCCTPVPVSLI